MKMSFLYWEGFSVALTVKNLFFFLSPSYISSCAALFRMRRLLSPVTCPMADVDDSPVPSLRIGTSEEHER